ncbi:MAG: hypothetical protein ACRDGV_10805 [Candidatus Limnocylindria bacterium]
MIIIIEVKVADDGRPPEGSPVRVEVRDTSYADAPAVTIGAARGHVRGHGSWLETVEVETDSLPDGCTVFAHVDVDDDGRVSPGDFLTTESYPVPREAEPRVSVQVRRV